MLEWIPHVTRNIDSLHFKRAEVINFSRLIVSAQNNVNVSSRSAVCVFQPNGTNVPHLAGSGGTGGTAGLSGSGAGGSSIGIAYHGAIVVSDTTPTSGIAGHGVPASVSGPREDGPVTLPASADGQVAVTTTF